MSVISSPVSKPRRWLHLWPLALFLLLASCSAAKFFAPKRIKLCTATTERKPVIAHGAN